MTVISKTVLKEIDNREFRAEYMASRVRTLIAFQIRALRKQRGKSQEDFAKLLGKPQSTVSRLEDPEYGKASLQSLLDVASALDVALAVRFVPFNEFLVRTADVSPDALEVEGYARSQMNHLRVAHTQVPRSTKGTSTASGAVRLCYTSVDPNIPRAQPITWLPN